MYIVVQHRISDPAGFQQRGQEMLNKVPVGLKPHQFFPASGAPAAFCLWEAASLDDLKAFVDGSLAPASAQDYYAVDAEHALGLPGR